MTLAYVAIADQTAKKEMEGLLMKNEKEWITFAKDEKNVWNFVTKGTEPLMHDPVLAMCLFRQPIMGGYYFTVYSWYSDGKRYNTYTINVHQTFGWIWNNSHMSRVVDNRTKKWYHIVAQYHRGNCSVLELCVCDKVSESVRAWILVGKRMGICHDMSMFIAKMVWNGRFR